MALFFYRVVLLAAVYLRAETPGCRDMGKKKTPQKAVCGLLRGVSFMII